MALVAAPSCAREELPPGAPAPDSPVTGPPPGPPTPPTPTPTLVEPRDGLVEVRPRPFEEVEILTSRRLRVHFWSGVEECYGLDRVEVEETPDAVTITLHEGREPAAEVCIEIAVRKAVDVTLDGPLGDRQIKDGAAQDR